MSNNFKYGDAVGHTPQLSVLKALWNSSTKSSFARISNPG
jgi:hypothetical protein